MDIKSYVVDYVNPHNGREHTAIIIKLREDGSVNLTHFDPESGLMQTRFGVVYSQELQANTFHWTDDDNKPQDADEAKAVALATVTSVQNITGPPPTASIHPVNSPNPAQSVQPTPVVATGSQELAQGDAAQPDAPTAQPQDIPTPAAEPNQGEE